MFDSKPTKKRQGPCFQLACSIMGETNIKTNMANDGVKVSVNKNIYKFRKVTKEGRVHSVMEGVRRVSTEQVIVELGLDR